MLQNGFSRNNCRNSRNPATIAGFFMLNSARAKDARRLIFTFALQNYNKYPTIWHKTVFNTTIIISLMIF
jgi:hypothetical protein